MPPLQTQSQIPPKSDGPSNTVWGLLIGAAALLDLTQFLLDLSVIGFLLNPLIDFCVGAALPLIFKYFLGVSVNWKKAIPWVAGPVWEMLTDGLFPFGWVLEIVLTMVIDKIERKTKKLTNLPI